MAPKGLLPCSQKSSTVFYLEPYFFILIQRTLPPSKQFAHIRGSRITTQYLFFLFFFTVNCCYSRPDFHHARSPPLVACPCLVILYAGGYPADADTSIRSLRTMHDVVTRGALKHIRKQQGIPIELTRFICLVMH